MNKEEINLKELAKDRNFQNEIKTIFQHKMLDKITKIGNEQVYEIIEYLQSQLDKSNNKIEKLRKLLIVKFWVNKNDVLSIIDEENE